MKHTQQVSGSVIEELHLTDLSIEKKFLLLSQMSVYVESEMVRRILDMLTVQDREECIKKLDAKEDIWEFVFSRVQEKYFWKLFEEITRNTRELIIER